MRTPARIVVPVAAAALPLTSCSSTANDTGGDQISLITDGTLTVCTNPPYEPFEFEQDGKVVGLDMDIVNEVAKDLGVELAIKVTLFEGIQSGEDLNSSNCDVVASGITINDVRESKMDFSEPYFDADQGLLVPAGSSLASVEDLAGLTVGVQQATTGAEYATEQGLETLEFEDLGLQIEALRAGQIDAVINDIAVLGPFASADFEVGTTFPTGEQYGLGVKTGNTALLAAVNDTLARILSVVLIAVVVVLALTADWGRIGEAFFNKVAFQNIAPDLPGAALNTVVYTFAAFAVGLSLGTLLALMKLSSVRVWRVLATGYVEFFRGIPPLLVVLAFGY